MFSKMEVQKDFEMRQHLEAAVHSCSAELAQASITPEEATNMLDHTLPDAGPPMSLTYKIDRYDKVRRWAQTVMLPLHAPYTSSLTRPD